MHKTPYQSQPIESFWSSAVREPQETNTLMAIEPLTSILSKETIVCSAGSCFAQYIGKELYSRGFDYIKSALSGERIESFGFGNIYTSRHMSQWLEFALGKREWSTASVFQTPDGFHDYILPHLEALSTEHEVFKRRKRIAEELKAGLSKAQVFIFTLGLTETWVNLVGDVFPLCPGVHGGEFDPAAHKFLNLNTSDVATDLAEIHRHLMDINPEIHLILTVSPVPLTATATDEHVLVANARSKAILRTAADEFVTASERVSYFPSYELISHNSRGDDRIQENLRNVSQQGVKLVMAHAFDDQTELKNATIGTSDNAVLLADTADEALCEEAMLEATRRSASQNDQSTGLYLVGDSHMGNLSKALDGLNVSHNGGMIMNGSGFSDGKMSPCTEKIFAPEESPDAAKFWSKAFSSLSSGNGNNIILTNIGLQTHRTLPAISNYYQSLILTQSLVEKYFKQKYRLQLEILKSLRTYGKVVLVEDPNFYSFLSGNRSNAIVGNNYNFDIYCSYLREFAAENEIEYFKPCEEILQSVFMETKNIGSLIADDFFHGTQIYYSRLAQLIINRYGASELAKVA